MERVQNGSGCAGLRSVGSLRPYPPPHLSAPTPPAPAPHFAHLTADSSMPEPTRAGRISTSWRYQNDNPIILFEDIQLVPQAVNQFAADGIGGNGNSLLTQLFGIGPGMVGESSGATSSGWGVGNVINFPINPIFQDR